MKKYVFIYLLLFTTWSISASSEEYIAGTLENVDLIIEDLLNEAGHNRGELYFAINRNNYSIRLSIKLVGAKNVEDELAPYTIVIKPLERIKLGKVIQKNLKEEASWNYEWEVEPDTH